MKRIKKLLAVMLAAIMVMSMGTSVFADDDTTSITIKNVATSSHTFKAYQVFDGDVSGSTMSNVTWGTGIDSSKLLSAIVNLTDTDTLYSYFNSKGITVNSSAADVAKIVADNYSQTTFVTAFAALVQSCVKEEATGSSSGGTVQSDGTYTYTISSLDPGYYLVTDSTTSTSDDAVSKYMLKVISGASNELDTKSVVPTVSKTVTNTSDTESVATSASAGETVSFTLIGSVPSDVDDYYISYTYKFVDTMSTNLTYVEDSIVVKTYTNAECTNGEETLSNTSSNDNAYYTVTASGQSVTVEISNALKLAGKYIKVTYSATVGSDITAGNAETNEVYIEYTNDSNTSGTGQTTTEKVYVYTFDLDLVKTYNGTAPESGDQAQFTLYKEASVSSETNFTGTTKYYTISGNTVTEASSYVVDTKYYVFVDAQTVSGESSYSATFSDLGEGSYILIETHTPAGYNTADAVSFTIAATYDESGNVTSLTSSTGVSPKENYTTSKVTTTVANNAGSSLPSTGGIGTTIFYVVGAILVLGAGVVLITRRRMAR